MEIVGSVKLSQIVEESFNVLKNIFSCHPCDQELLLRFVVMQA